MLLHIHLKVVRCLDCHPMAVRVSRKVGERVACGGALLDLIGFLLGAHEGFWAFAGKVGFALGAVAVLLLHKEEHLRDHPIALEPAVEDDDPGEL